MSSRENSSNHGKRNIYKITMMTLSTNIIYHENNVLMYIDTKAQFRMIYFQIGFLLTIIKIYLITYCNKRGNWTKIIWKTSPKRQLWLTRSSLTCCVAGRWRERTLPRRRSENILNSSHRKLDSLREDHRQHDRSKEVTATVDVRKRLLRKERRCVSEHRCAEKCE